MQQQQAPAKKKKKIKVPRVVNGVDTLVEIEVDDDSSVAWGANDKHTLLNKRLTRVDGHVKVSGAAEYTHDKRVPGMLYGRAAHPRRQGRRRRDRRGGGRGEQPRLRSGREAEPHGRGRREAREGGAG